ncbi:HNH endonuclease [Frigidibacter mobilis]|uniref:HNH domain-containing protein n=1 Tax=Frigidibacter mobilis TaxID=1335048 RepID=A0A159Z287_9RHOB|nr:HNH endonuclease [Frigidibacter mobilis]AMY69091.1 hypothetical protein AKL17_1841 [Frigidibacter mobilis]
MPEPIRWDWSEPKRMRGLASVEDHILWTYSLLSVSRHIMKCGKSGKPYPYLGGRTKAANILMSSYQKQQRNIGTLDRDDALAQDAASACAHCGCTAPRYHWDHLIPRSKLNGGYVALNQVRSCPRCNTSRGDRELMAWYRANSTFPTLGVLRRYLKLCYFYSVQRGCLGQPVEEALLTGLPFDPRELPRKFPPVEALVWDYGYPE